MGTDNEAKQPKLRRWHAWAILDSEEAFYRLSWKNPSTVVSVQNLIEMGWSAIPVEIVEQAAGEK